LATEWQPLVFLASHASRALVLSLVATLALVRLSPRRFSARDVLLLATFGLATWFSSRAVFWWLALCPFVLLSHLRALLEKAGLPCGDGAGAVGKAGRAALAVGLAAALALVVISAPGRWLLRGQARPLEEQVAEATPVRLAEALQKWMAR